MGYLVDSNVLIDYASNRFSQAQLKALDILFDKTIQISVISKIEIFGYNIELEEEAKMQLLITYPNIIMLSELIVDRTIFIKKGVKIKTPDAIIAATALVNDLTLITHNVADFKRVTDLKLLNPYDM